MRESEIGRRIKLGRSMTDVGQGVVVMKESKSWSFGDELLAPTEFFRLLPMQSFCHKCPKLCGNCRRMQEIQFSPF